MRTKSLGRFLCALLCMALALSLTGTALAFDPGEDGDSPISIRITPPSGWATQRAEVEVRVTDNAGAGFQSAQVQAGSGSWRDITAELEQTENRWYTVVEITENCTVVVKVTGKDGIVYEKSQYIHCFNTDDDHRTPTAADPTPSTSPQPSAGPMTPPGGQGTVIDNVSGTSAESSREFFTIATPDENVFYLVIDRNRDSENVYFLNAVTEGDLLALAEKDKDGPSQSAIPDPEPVCNCKDKCAPGAVKTDCPVCLLSMKDCAGTAAPDPVEPEKPKEGGGSGTIFIVLLAALAAGGAGYYFKIYKPKKELADAEDLDELTGGGEEPTVNEDDLPPARYTEPAPVPYAEPDEPDYPVGYGDEDET